MQKTHTKLIREGRYIAKVDVEMIETGDDWSPYLSVEASYKLDDVRNALKQGDIRAASRLARVYSLTPVAA